MRIDGALGFFQETSPPNTNKKNKKISSVWGPVPGPTVPCPTIESFSNMFTLNRKHQNCYRLVPYLLTTLDKQCDMANLLQAVKPLFYSSLNRKSVFKCCNWIKVPAASLRAGFCEGWKTAFGFLRV